MTNTTIFFPTKPTSTKNHRANLSHKKMNQQEEPQRPPPEKFPAEQDPIKYGDVFNVSGELANAAVVAADAAAMQAAETALFGEAQRSGPAAVMGSAAAFNECFGLAGHGGGDDVARAQGVMVSERIVGGDRVIMEAVGGQVVGQYIEPEETQDGEEVDPEAITIGEALEATALSMPDKPLDKSDAAAIRAAEGRTVNATHLGGIGSMAEAAATLNACTDRGEYKTTIFDVIGDATEKLTWDKVVTLEDAAKVIGAETSNKPDLTTTPGGVAATMATAARLNLDR